MIFLVYLLFFASFLQISHSSVGLYARNTIKQYYTPVENEHKQVIWKNKKITNQPNILLIVADDFGYNDALGLKNIESIYKNGVDFNNAYAGHATCAPSRASLLTGKFSTKIGAEFTPHPASLDLLMHFQNNIVHKNIVNFTNLVNNPSMEYLALNKSEVMISNVLKKHNYTNYFVGKWHLGEMDGHRPLERGFDESLAFLYGASMYAEETDNKIVTAQAVESLYNSYMANLLPFGISHNNGKMFKPNEYMTDYLSNNVVDIIKNERNARDPFFITLAYNAPHSPYQALKSDYDLETGEHHEKVYKAMLRSVDRGIGNIIETLKNENEYNNTIIIFTSDNGGTHLAGVDNINHPYNGWKCTFLEGGIRVPLFIQWPNKIQPNTKCDTTVSHVDIFSTMSALVNYNNEDIDGVNLIPYILKEKNDEPHESLFWRSEDYVTIKVNEWKLSIARHMNKSWFFNLIDDHKEENNLMDFIYSNGTIKYEYDKIYRHMTDTEKQQIAPSWNSPIKTAIPLYKKVITSEDDDYVYWAI